MANNIAFQAMGKTVKVTATGPANTESAAFTITADSPSNQYYLSNDGVNNFVYVWISATSAFNVALPESNVSGSYVIPLPPFSYKVITAAQVKAGGNVYAKVIGDSTNSACYVTPGEGL
jgi:hypothetical protein